MAERMRSRLERLTLEQLGPDWENPRFLPGTDEQFRSDEDVYAYIDLNYDAFPVADSIALHGYFESEPLIAMPGEGDVYVVLEGNRRLTALKALADPGIRALMRDRRWSQLPPEVELPEDLPVLVVQSRAQVAPILGFRHITGITPWDPYQQALYVASLIDGEDMSADEVAELIGRDASEVRAFYRNFSIVQQARDEFGMPDTKRIVDEFGVWSRAMTSVGIRQYINAPPPRGVFEGEYPLDSDAGERLGRLVTWLFGVPRSAEDRKQGKQSRTGRVISDSRQLSRLGKAIQHPRGLEALEAGKDLEGAEKAMLDRPAQFAAALREAKDVLESAEEQKPRRTSKAALELLGELAELVERLRS